MELIYATKGSDAYFTYIRTQQNYLDMYMKAMYKFRVWQIPNISEEEAQKLIRLFFATYSNNRNEDLISWQQQKIDEENLRRQMRWDEMKAEILRQGINMAEHDAMMKIYIGSAGAITGIALICFFPPAGGYFASALNLGETMLGAADIAFNIAGIQAGYSQLKDLEQGILDDDKEYNIVKGMLIYQFPDGGALVYDLAEVAVGFTSVIGNFVSIDKLMGTINGYDLKTLINAVLLGGNQGVSTISVGNGIWQLK